MFEELYSNDQRPGVSGGHWGATGRSQQVAVAQRRNAPLGPEHSWHYFHPGRVDAVHAPEDFMQLMHEVDPRLRVVWHPIKQRWCVWFPNPDVHFWMCAGWKLIFIVQYPDESFMPLDNRCLAEAWTRSPRKTATGKLYFDQVINQIRRDYVKKEDAHHDEIAQVAKDQWRYAQIKNIGNGSKYCDHEVGN